MADEEKPPFDPTQPFEPTAPEEKPAFDPGKPFEPVLASGEKPVFDPTQPSAPASDDDKIKLAQSALTAKQQELSAETAGVRMPLVSAKTDDLTSLTPAPVVPNLQLATGSGPLGAGQPSYRPVSLIEEGGAVPHASLDTPTRDLTPDQVRETLKPLGPDVSKAYVDSRLGPPGDESVLNKLLPEIQKGSAEAGNSLLHGIGAALNYGHDVINEAVPGFLDQINVRPDFTPLPSDPNSSVLTNQAKAVYNQIGEFATPMMSPAMIATFLAGGAIPKLAKPIGAYFLTDTVRNIPAAIDAVKESLNTPVGSQERTEAAIQLTGLLAFTHLLSKHQFEAKVTAPAGAKTAAEIRAGATAAETARPHESLARTIEPSNVATAKTDAAAVAPVAPEFAKALTEVEAARPPAPPAAPAVRFIPESGRLDDAVLHVVQNTTDKTLSAILKKVLSLGMETTIGRNTDVTVPDTDGVLYRYDGYFNRATNHVQIREGAKTTPEEYHELVAHEALHAASAYLIDHPEVPGARDFGQEIGRLRQTALTHLGDAGVAQWKTAFDSDHEFIANMGSKAFRDAMKAIPTERGGKNVFETLVDFLMKTLGIAQDSVEGRAFKAIMDIDAGTRDQAARAHIMKDLPVSGRALYPEPALPAGKKAVELTHAEREARDKKYMAAVRAVIDTPGLTQTQKAAEFRRVHVEAFPEMKASYEESGFSTHGITADPTKAAEKLGLQYQGINHLTGDLEFVDLQHGGNISVPKGATETEIAAYRDAKREQFDKGKLVRSGELNMEGWNEVKTRTNAQLDAIRATIRARPEELATPAEGGKLGANEKDAQGGNVERKFRVDTPDARGDFADGVARTQKYHPFGASVEVKPAEFYNDPANRLFLSENRLAGAAVDARGDLVSVFNVPAAKKTDINPILAEASRYAKTLDAFDIKGKLPELYAGHGWRPAARVAFNDEFAPAGWDYAKAGRPDIVLMVHDPAGVSGLPEAKDYAAVRDQVPVFSDYDAALTAQQAAVAKVGKEDVLGAGKQVVNREESRISTRSPSGKGAESPHDQVLSTDIKKVFESPRQLGKIAGKLSGEVWGDAVKKRLFIPKDLISPKDPNATVENTIEFFKRNKLALYEKIKDLPWFKRATKQYEGYNIFGHELAENYGRTPEQIMGAAAAMSPQRSPDQGFSYAERMAHMLKHDASTTPWDDSMSKAARKFNTPASAADIKRMKGKTYSDLTDPIDKAMWMRAYDEAFNPPEHHMVTPEGTRGDLARNIGGDPTAVAWPPYPQIAKGLLALEGTRLSDILQTHKISSFYNNMIAPHSKAGDYTSDTHDSGAGWAKSVGSTSPEILQHFQGMSNKATGQKGLYLLHEEAGRRAAKEVGLLSQEFQAGLWTGQKGMMSLDVMSEKAVASIDKLWEAAHRGTITEAEARNQAYDIALADHGGQIIEPAWLRGPRDSSAEGAGAADNAEKLSGDRRVSTGTSPTGTGSGATSRSAEEGVLGSGKIPTDEDVTDALSADKKALVGAARNLAPGTRVGVRIDIPAFERHGTYVQTIHEPAASGKVGKRIGYDSVVSLDNPTFFSNERGSQKIAEGSAKFPVATVEGKYNPEERGLPQDVDSWSQVGFNPKRHSYFYEKESGEPVVGGEKAISLGNTVYVKNPEFAQPEEFLYAGKTPVKRLIEETTGLRQTKAEANEAMEKAISRVEVFSVQLKAREKGGQEGRAAATRELRNQFADDLTSIREDQEEVRRTLTNFVNLSLPKEERGAYIGRIAQALAVPDILNGDPAVIYHRAFRVMQDIADRSEEVFKTDVVNQIKASFTKFVDSPGIDVAYRSRLKNLLDSVSLTKPTELTISRLESLRQFVNAEVAAGREPSVPKDVVDNLATLVKLPLRDMPVNALVELQGEINRLAALGKVKAILMKARWDAEKKASLEDLEKSESTPIEGRAQFRAQPTESLTPGQKFSNTVKSPGGVLQNIETSIAPTDQLMDHLDGSHGTYDGWASRNIKGKIDLAHNKKEGELAPIRDKSRAIAQQYELKKADFETIGVKGVMRMIGRERLEEMGVRKDILDRIDATPLTEGQKAFDDYTQQVYKDLGLRVQDVAHKLYQIPVELVENYMPLMKDWAADVTREPIEPGADPLRSEIPFDEQATLRQLQHDTNPKVISRTEQGFLKARIEGAKGAVRLNAQDVFERHVGDALHFVHAQPVLKMLGEIARTPTLEAKYGKVGQKFILDLLDTVATQGQVNHLQRIRWVDWVRNSTSKGAVAFRLASNVVHTSQIPLAAYHAGGPGWWNKGLGLAISEAGQKFLRANAAETFVRSGGEPAQVEAETISKIGRAGFFIARNIDKLNSQATFLGRYAKEMMKKGVAAEDIFNVPVDTEVQALALRRMRRAVASPLAKDVPQMTSRGTGLGGGNVSVARAINQFRNIFLDNWSNVRHDILRVGIADTQRAIDLMRAGEKAAGLKTIGDTLSHRAAVSAAIIMGVALETGIKMYTKQGLAAATGGTPPPRKDDDTFTSQFEHHLINRVPFVGQLTAMAMYGDTGVPVIDSIVNVMSEGYTGTIKSKNPETQAKHLTKAVSNVGTVLGVPGISQAAELAQPYVQKGLKNVLPDRRKKKRTATF